MEINKVQKQRISYVEKINEVQEKFKISAHQRIKELLGIRHTLNKEILLLRDKIAQKRYQERKTLLKGKKNETTLY